MPRPTPPPATTDPTARPPRWAEDPLLSWAEGHLIILGKERLPHRAESPFSGPWGFREGERMLAEGVGARRGFSHQHGVGPAAYGDGWPTPFQLGDLIHQRDQVTVTRALHSNSLSTSSVDSPPARRQSLPQDQISRATRPMANPLPGQRPAARFRARFLDPLFFKVQFAATARNTSPFSPPPGRKTTTRPRSDLSPGALSAIPLIFLLVVPVGEAVSFQPWRGSAIESWVWLAQL
jgi:hypothetical protein